MTDKPAQEPVRIVQGGGWPMPADTARQDRIDAQRYRHMRLNAAFQSRNGPGVYWYLPRWNSGLPVGERLDAAIDAALEAEVRKG